MVCHGLNAQEGLNAKSLITVRCLAHSDLETTRVSCRVSVFVYMN